MVRDISVVMYIEVPTSQDHKSLLWEHNDPKKVNQEISYILNECCSKLENFGVNVFYKMKDSNNQEIKLDLP